MTVKIIHQIVGRKTNRVVDACLGSWKHLKKFGFEILYWDDEAILQFLSVHYVFATKAFKYARNHAEAADIARYLIIFHFGGYYVDWDIQLLNPNGFLSLADKYDLGFLVVDPTNGTLASECFSAAPREPFLLSLVGDIISIYDNNERDKMGTPQYSGPFRMAESLKKHNNSSQMLINVSDIFAYSYSEIREMPPKKITQPLIHYWLHSWVDD